MIRRAGWFAPATAAVLLGSAAVRLQRWREAYWGDLLIPPDGDSLYHLRRSLQMAAEGRAVATFDPGVNWPHGAHVPWAPGFDVAGAAFARLAEALGMPGTVGVAILPVALGVGVVALAMALAHAAAPAGMRRSAAMGAGVIAALLPQAVLSSRFARTDHHVAEAAIAAGLALWAVRGVSGGRHGIRYELAGALLSGVGVLTFTGTPLYVAIAAVPLLVHALLTEPRRGPPPGACGLLIGAGLAAIATAPLVGSHGHGVSFGFPSFLQPALVGLAGTGIALASVAAHVGPPPRRAAVLSVLVLGALGIGLLIPGLGAQVVAGIRGWLLARDPWIAGIDEFQPVWGSAVGWVRIHAMWGAMGLALPVLCVAAARWGWNDRPPVAAALLFQAIAFCLLAVLQIRFGRVAIPVLAASGGIAVACACAWLPVRTTLATALAPAACALVLAADPAVWKVLAGAPSVENDGLVAASLDLRTAAGAENGPGVLAPWDMGHHVLVVSGHPVVANGFGSYLDAAGYDETSKAYTLSEPMLLGWMRERRLGYFVGGASVFYRKVRGPGDRTPFLASTGGGRIDLEYLRAVPLSATVLGGSGVPEAEVPHLAHFLPRFASLQMLAGLAFPLPVIWTFELVPGARIEGCARPGTRAVLEVDLAERGRPHVWRAWADADAAGHFELTIPLPTGYARPTLRTGSSARLRAGDAPPLALEIPESAVRSGARISAGTCPPP